MSFSEKIGHNINPLKLPRYFGQVITKSETSHKSLITELNNYSSASSSEMFYPIIKHQVDYILSNLGEHTRRFTSLRGFSELYDKALKTAPFDVLLEDRATKINILDESKFLYSVYSNLAHKLFHNRKKGKPLLPFEAFASYHESGLYKKIPAGQYTVDDLKDIYLEALLKGKDSMQLFSKEFNSEDVQKGAVIVEQSLNEALKVNLIESLGCKKIKNDMVEIFAKSIGEDKLAIKVINKFFHNQEEYYIKFINTLLKDAGYTDPITNKIAELFSHNFNHETCQVFGRGNKYVSFKDINKLLLSDIQILIDKNNDKGAVLLGDILRFFPKDANTLADIDTVDGKILLGKTGYTKQDLSDSIDKIKSVVYDIFISEHQTKKTQVTENKKAR